MWNSPKVRIGGVHFILVPSAFLRSISLGLTCLSDKNRDVEGYFATVSIKIPVAWCNH